jgi:hypothetical protein
MFRFLGKGLPSCPTRAGLSDLPKKPSTGNKEQGKFGGHPYLTGISKMAGLYLYP